MVCLHSVEQESPWRVPELKQWLVTSPSECPVNLALPPSGLRECVPCAETHIQMHGLTQTPSLLRKLRRQAVQLPLPAALSSHSHLPSVLVSCSLQLTSMILHTTCWWCFKSLYVKTFTFVEYVMFSVHVENQIRAVICLLQTLVIYMVNSRPSFKDNPLSFSVVTLLYTRTSCSSSFHAPPTPS